MGRLSRGSLDVWCFLLGGNCQVLCMEGLLTLAYVAQRTQPRIQSWGEELSLHFKDSQSVVSTGLDCAGRAKAPQCLERSDCCCLCVIAILLPVIGAARVMNAVKALVMQAQYLYRDLAEEEKPVAQAVPLICQAQVTHAPS
eukprot:2917027-Amphidinium_carterae.2